LLQYGCAERARFSSALLRACLFEKRCPALLTFLFGVKGCLRAANLLLCGAIDVGAGAAARETFALQLHSYR
jgi:hypothetical protein